MDTVEVLGGRGATLGDMRVGKFALNRHFKKRRERNSGKCWEIVVQLWATCPCGVAVKMGILTCEFHIFHPEYEAGSGWMSEH